jgi:hypothetical protein
MKPTLSLFIALLILSANAENQSITCGDGEFKWESVKTYYSGGVPVGVQTNALTWKSDNSGCGILMTLDQQVWSGTAHIYDSFTSLDPQCGNGITWAVNTVSPWDFFAGAYDSISVTSVITWSNHGGAVSATATTSNPDIDQHSVWVDWVKSGKKIVPRITFGTQPSKFNRVLSP